MTKNTKHEHVPEALARIQATKTQLRMLTLVFYGRHFHTHQYDTCKQEKMRTQETTFLFSLMTFDVERGGAGRERGLRRMTCRAPPGKKQEITSYPWII